MKNHLKYHKLKNSLLIKQIPQNKPYKSHWNLRWKRKSDNQPTFGIIFTKHLILFLKMRL